MGKATVETLSTDVQYIKEAIEKLDHKLDNNFMPKSEVMLRLAELNKEISGLNLKIIDVEKDCKKRDWRSHTLTSVLTALGVLAITYIFNDVVLRR
jgi:hypothetical protein